MEHYGDIRAICGYTLPPVDVVTGGSPCQDLSIAGKRAGLAGERSSLFLEQIRVVKELRNADRQRGRTGEFVRPRFMLWENVPGAFSSNGGRDFQTVLSEIVKIAEPAAPDVPLPEKGWPKAGILMGDGWSVAWRVLDAQYWGVPQRRRRICLVADFGGHAAPEVLFIRKSVSGDTDAGAAAGKGSAGAVAACAYPPVARSLTARYDGSPCLDRGPNVVFCIQGNTIEREAKMHGSGVSQEPIYTLNTVDRHAVLAAGFKGGQSGASSLGWQEEIASTLSAEMSGVEPTVYDARGNGDGQTVCTLAGDHANRVTDYTPILATMHGYGDYALTGTARTIRAGHDINMGDLVCDSIVRRLTPTECERLQGFPDGWTDIGAWKDSKGRVRETSDAARYKALGNSLALPPWKWVLKRIAAQYERDATLGSLFDGIGGFPLLWEQLNGRGSALWASEVEEFPIAVTKRHFGDEATSEKGDLWNFCKKRAAVSVEA